MDLWKVGWRKCFFNNVLDNIGYVVCSFESASLASAVKQIPHFRNVKADFLALTNRLFLCRLRYPVQSACNFLFNSM